MQSDSVLRIARFFARLPLWLLHACGAILGWVVYLSSPKYRRRLRANLAQAVGPMQARRLLPKVVASAGRATLELPWVWLRPLDEVLAKVRLEGGEVFERARAEGRGVLFLTPHVGCFEVLSLLVGRDHPLTILYRPPRKRELEALMVAGRERGKVELAATDLSGVRKLIKRLRAGESVGLLPDQVPAKGEGAWVPFFGRPAWTMTLAARLSEVQGVQVILTWAERLPRGQGYVMRMVEPAEPIAGDTLARCAALNREVERIVLACPGQYLWGYHRYKCPAGVSRPEQEGVAC